MKANIKLKYEDAKVLDIIDWNAGATFCVFQLCDGRKVYINTGEIMVIVIENEK